MKKQKVKIDPKSLIKFSGVAKVFGISSATIRADRKYPKFTQLQMEELESFLEAWIERSQKVADKYGEDYKKVV